MLTRPELTGLAEGIDVAGRAGQKSACRLAIEEALLEPEQVR